MNRLVVIAVLLLLLIVILFFAYRRIVESIKDEETDLDEQCDAMTVVFLIAGLSTILVPAIGYVATHPFAR